MINDTKRMDLLMQTLKSCGIVGCGSDATRLAKEVLETEEKVRVDFEKRSEEMLNKLDENIKKRASGIKPGKGRKLEIIDKPRKIQLENKELYDEAKTLHEIMKEDDEVVYSDVAKNENTDIKEVDEFVKEEPKEEPKIEVKEEVKVIRIEETTKPKPQKICLEANVDLSSMFNVNK